MNNARLRYASSQILQRNMRSSRCSIALSLMKAKGTHIAIIVLCSAARFVCDHEHTCGLFLLTYKLVYVREVAWRFCGLERAVFQVK